MSEFIEPDSKPAIEHASDDIGTSDDGIIYVNPADIGNDSGRTTGSDTGSDTGSRRRGRPPGSRNRTSKDTASLSGVDIGDILKSIHALLSVKAGPHWLLDDAEAKQLDKAIKKAMRHQDMKVTQKQMDYAFAAYVIATVYGSRVVTSVALARNPNKRARQQATQQATQQAASTGGVVFEFPAMPNNNAPFGGPLNTL